MTLRQYLATMIIATLLCLTAWGFVLVNVDPFTAGALSFGFFYLSLFLSLIGIFSLALFFGYKAFSRVEYPIFKYVQRSFREALLVSVFIIVFVYLQMHSWLNWLTAGILILLFLLSFSFTMSLKQRPTPITHDLDLP